MAEEFLMILEGGPFPDQYKAPEGVDWPLPDVIPAKDHIKGAYKKVFESKGPPSAQGDLIKLRGAKYTWDENLEPFELGE